LEWLEIYYETENNKVNYYDIGYRFMPQFWGKGYATEATKAWLKLGFEEMNLQEIIGAAHQENKASRRVLEKCGLQFVEQFMWHDLTL
jgi:RimJ/RimL family protein N-acetyltransferase